MYSWVAALALAGAASALDPLVALTKEGAVRGAPAAANVTEFLGIPFAAPPLRFADAAAAAPWNGTRASRPPAECAQASAMGKYEGKNFQGLFEAWTAQCGACPGIFSVTAVVRCCVR